MGNRTTDVGLYHYAQSYLRAAKALVAAKVRSTHADAPVRFLYYHSIELFLKSYLRLHKHSPSKLRGIGHEVPKLAKRCHSRGLTFDDEDWEVLKLMWEDGNFFLPRYIETGPFCIPALEALDRTASALHKQVAAALRKAGHPLRPI